MHLVAPEDFQRNAIYRLDLLEMPLKNLGCAEFAQSQAAPILEIEMLAVDAPKGHDQTASREDGRQPKH